MPPPIAARSLSPSRPRRAAHRRSARAPPAAQGAARAQSPSCRRVRRPTAHQHPHRPAPQPRRSCARRTADCTPRTHGATPSAASSSSATPRHARPPTAPLSGSRTSRRRVDRVARTARAAAPDAPVGCMASHWPPGDGAAGMASSAQPTLYRAMAEPSSAFSVAVVHEKARRRKRSAAPPPTANAAAPPDVLCSSACAIVPLYPNDDTPPTSPPISPDPIAARLVGSAHATPPRSASPTRRLSRRSCAFGAASPRVSPAASTSSPTIAAAVS
eukprot:scaffold118133_cov68-Phaeocystis_antarctica.AAC.2